MLLLKRCLTSPCNPYFLRFHNNKLPSWYKLWYGIIFPTVTARPLNSHSYDTELPNPQSPLLIYVRRACICNHIHDVMTNPCPNLNKWHRCIAVEYNTVLNTKGRKLKLFFRVLAMISKKAPHISPLRASYGASFLSSLEKRHRGIGIMHCITPLYRLIICMHIFLHTRLISPFLVEQNTIVSARRHFKQIFLHECYCFWSIFHWKIILACKVTINWRCFV